MKTKIILIIGLFISTISFGQSADEIVSRYLDAVGGKKSLDAIKSVKMTGSVEVGPNMKAPFSMIMKDKTKSRFELEIQGMKMITAVSGDSGWKVVPFTGKTDPERMSPEEVKDSKEQADFTGDLYNWKEKGSAVELVDKEDMEGTEVFKVKITKKEGDITYMYLDAVSYLPLKQSTKIKMKDKEMETATLFSNYKAVNGIKFAFAMEMRQGDDATSPGQVMTIETIEVNPAVSEDLFKMPPMKSAVDPAGTTK